MAKQSFHYPADSFDEVFGNKDRVLVVMAHPDDNEVICGGLVARFVSEGKAVHLVVTTNGGKGMGDQKISESEFAAIRIQEQEKAAAILGIPSGECYNLGVPDGELEPSLENIGKIVAHIREFKPDIVITHCPDETINTFSSAKGIYWANHRDHRHTAQITTDAVYPYSRDRGFFPAQLKAGLTPHEVTEILYSDAYEHPLRRYFDVTDFIDQKRQALMACQSVIPAGHVDEYIDELQIGDRYYEQLRWVTGL